MGKSGEEKRYRVAYWLTDEDGREDAMEFGSLPEAEHFCKSMGMSMMAEIQEYDGAAGRYKAIVPPYSEEVLNVKAVHGNRI